MSEEVVKTAKDLPDPFEQPPAYPGMPVIFWPNQTLATSSQGIGWVWRVEGDTCHIAIPGGSGYEVREYCVHKNDWALKERPARFEDDQCGVWDYTTQIIEHNEMLLTIRGLQEAFSGSMGIVSEVQELRDEVEELKKLFGSQKVGAKKKPGPKPKEKPAPKEKVEVPLPEAKTEETVTA